MTTWNKMCEGCKVKGETCSDCEARKEGFDNYKDMIETLGVD